MLGLRNAFLAPTCTIEQIALKSTVMLRYFHRVLDWRLAVSVSALLGATDAAAGPSRGQNECGSTLSNHLVVREAEAGDANAMVYLGKKLLQQYCTAAQQKEGVRFLALAVNAENPEAMFVLGAFLISDATAEAEERLGLDYVERSAELGHARAAAFFGAHLMSVSQTDDQRDKAFLWLGRAANDGSVLAAMTLSELYKGGLHGVVQDRCVAALWRETAGLLQHPEMDFSHHTDIACR